MLKIENLSVSYGDVMALRGVSLEIQQGEAVVIIGANGAGKTTTLKTISGLIKPRSGKLSFKGRDITGLAPHEIARAGIAHVPEGRQVFTNLSVADNLAMGGYLWRNDKKRFEQLYNRILELFPRLNERKNQLAGTLSGGEQQMLAIGRAMMSDPALLILDEPSLGLAPLMVKEVFSYLERLHREAGLTILLVEQVAAVALKLCDRGYVLENGRLALSGNSAELKDNPRIRELYLGVGATGAVTE
jgi:branched-chain amino acid transport system ATP-binding protein